MKNFTLIAIAILMIGLVLATGCGKENPVGVDTDNKKTEDTKWDETVNPALTGLWVFVDAQVNGRQADLWDVLDMNNNSEFAAFIIDEDGGYYYFEGFFPNEEEIEVLFEMEGTIETRGNEFRISTDSAGDSGTWSIGGATLTLKTADGGENVTLTAEYIDMSGAGNVVSTMGAIDR